MPALKPLVIVALELAGNDGRCWSTQIGSGTGRAEIRRAGRRPARRARRSAKSQQTARRRPLRENEPKDVAVGVRGDGVGVAVAHDAAEMGLAVAEIGRSCDGCSGSCLSRCRSIGVVRRSARLLVGQCNRQSCGREIEDIKPDAGRELRLDDLIHLESASHPTHGIAEGLEPRAADRRRRLRGWCRRCPRGSQKKVLFGSNATPPGGVTVTERST